MKRWAGTVTLAVALLGLVPALAACGNSVHSVELDCVAFPDSSHGWVTGPIWQSDGSKWKGGTIRATTDGGMTWRAQKSGATRIPSSLAFADSDRGWVLESVNADVVNSQAPHVNTILATTNGGATWTKQYSNSDYELSAVACAGRTHAWAVGWALASRGIILATTDGGAHWRTQYLTKAGNLDDVAFADTSHGWVVGDDGILATTDGGKSWKRQGSFRRYGLTDVACADATHVWALGEVLGSSHWAILASNDGGAAWEVQYSSADFLGGMAFADDTHGWVVGDRGLILATTDGGQSWRPQPSGTTMDLYAVAVADTRHGLVVGNHFHGDPPFEGTFKGSVILRTTDGGATWNH